MTRAACLLALVALASLNPLFAGELLATADSAKATSPGPATLAPAGAAKAPAPTLKSTLKPSVQTVKAATLTVQTVPATVAPKAKEAVIKAATESASAVTPAAPASPAKPVVAPNPTVTPKVQVDTVKTQPIKTGPDPLKDSATARQYKVGNKPFNREEADHFLKVFAFKAKGKPESTAVNWVYRDARGALLTYEQGMSEFAYAFDSVPFLDPKEYVPDSLIRSKTDGLLKSILRDRAGEYSFINFEKTMVQARDTTLKQGAAPSLPAYYLGRYVRKLDGRFVLGENFQIRLSYGQGGAVNYLSYRNPSLKESPVKVKVATKEMVNAYLEKWRKEPSRLGRQYYPYHPDHLRIKALKPVKVIESYVLVQEKFRDNPGMDGTYLSPRITVLAEAVLYNSQKRLKLPAPTGPVLMHFHFPCTPAAGLCWPDGKQGIQEAARGDIGVRPPTPAGTAPPAQSPKSEGGPAKPAPAAN